MSLFTNLMSRLSLPGIGLMLAAGGLLLLVLRLQHAQAAHDIALEELATAKARIASAELTADLNAAALQTLQSDQRRAETLSNALTDRHHRQMRELTRLKEEIRHVASQDHCPQPGSDAALGWVLQQPATTAEPRHNPGEVAPAR
ncbi:hypothetical protein ACFSM5_16200 [Lacibacterium aquatile]|uniref:DUF2570 domain-containing protein n=1 Tax=Lacibacterium aquatile TaxID=1168082 RepID=A0ABW5DTL5_9PROT